MYVLPLLPLLLLLSACASPGSSMEQPAAPAPQPLPVAIALQVSEDIVELHRAYSARAFGGPTYDFDVHLGPILRSAVETTTHQLYREVVHAPAGPLPTISFDLAAYHSRISLKDGPLAVTAEATTELALQVYVRDAQGQTLLSPMVRGSASRSRTVMLGGVAQGAALIEETTRAAADQALAQLADLVHRERELNYDGIVIRPAP
jgi:hypothetical protein